MDYVLWVHLYFLLQNVKCFPFAEYLERIRKQNLETYYYDSTKTIEDEDEDELTSKTNKHLTEITKRREREIFKYSTWRLARGLPVKESWQTYSKWLYRNPTTALKLNPGSSKTYEVKQLTVHRPEIPNYDITTHKNVYLEKDAENENSESMQYDLTTVSYSSTEYLLPKPKHRQETNHHLLTFLLKEYTNAVEHTTAMKSIMRNLSDMKAESQNNGSFIRRKGPLLGIVITAIVLTIMLWVYARHCSTAADDNEWHVRGYLERGDWDTECPNTKMKLHICASKNQFKDYS